MSEKRSQDWGLVDISGDLRAIEPTYARMSSEALANAFPARGVQSPSKATDVGIVELVGEIHKSKCHDFQQRIKQLANNPQIAEILIYVDSPGGGICSVVNASDVVSRAAKHKPVTAVIEDVGASAAYWIIAGATRIVANRTAMVGSIGVLFAVLDTSAMLESLGVQVVMFVSGKIKGCGRPGTRLSSDQIQYLQHRVDSYANLFMADVARGRRMAPGKVKEIADGSCFIALEAKSNGLIDAVSTWDDELAAAWERQQGTIELRTRRKSERELLAEIEAAEAAALREQREKSERWELSRRLRG